MCEEHRTSSRAAGKLSIAVRRLAEKYPFHVSILERFKTACRPEVGTIAVAVSGDDIMLQYHPDFVLRTPFDVLGGVLLHEVHHVVFGHVTANPDEFPDTWARTIAEEVTANEFIHEPLPENAITLDQFPDLPPLQSTSDRYVQLARHVARAPALGPGKRSSRNSNDEDAGGIEGGQHGAGEARKEADQGTSHTKRSHILHTLDDHSVWDQIAEDRERAASVVRDVIHEATIEAGYANVPEELEGALVELGISTVPGQERYGLRHDQRGRLDWRCLLRRYVGQVLETRPVFNRPPRRFPELLGIVPGRRRQPCRPKIMAVIDTSGSITLKELELINAELARLARHYMVTVVECDAEIHSVYPFKPVEYLEGRGGTDFRPPFASDFLRRHRPDLIVYFTDGDGPAPEQAPRIPTLWCLLPDGEVPADCGRVVRME